MKIVVGRKLKVDNRGRFVPSSLFFLLSTLYFLLPGCTYNSSDQGPPSQTLEQRQDAAINDPIKNNYEENTKPYDISGGGINNLDKNALNKDLKNVFDP